MTRNMMIVGLAAIAALITGGLALRMVLQPADRFAGCRASAVAGGGDIGGPFTLVDETGTTVTETDVLQKPALVYFGYTFCPDVCPVDAARNAEAATILDGKGVEVTPVFISVDPARDTPEVLAEFTEYMHPRMIGLTGSPEQVKAAAKAYRAYARVHEPEEPGDDYYLVDHSTQTYLMLPGHGFVEFYNRGDSAQDMAESVQCFVEAG